MNKIIILICLIFLASCGNKKPQVVYKDRIVEVPTIVVEPYRRPSKIQPLGVLPSDALTEADRGDHEKITESFVISVQLLKGKLAEYKAALQPYYTPFNRAQGDNE